MKNIRTLAGIGSFLLVSTGVGCTSKQFFDAVPGSEAALAAKAKASVIPPSGVYTSEEFTDISTLEQVQVANRVDLLWMVDNSPSMADNQNKLATDLQSFADTYLSSGTRDLRIARVTSDAYKAGATTADCAGHQYCDANYAKLLVNVADGSQPTVAGARSGRPILSTIVPNGFVGNWIDQLKADFSTNMKVGVIGHSNERGAQSVIKFLGDNESGTPCAQRTAADPECFFRLNTIRGIVFLSDELDSTDFPGAGRPAGAIRDDAVVNYNMGVAKSTFDSFFKALDGTNDPKYFASVIVNQADVNAKKAYNKLSTLVQADGSNSYGSSSQQIDIVSASFSSILDSIGATVATDQTVYATSYTLLAVPDSITNVVVNAIAANGIENTIPNNAGYYHLENGNVLKVTIDLAASYPNTQKIVVKYIPQ